MAVLELERQVAVVELEGNFKQLSDRVNETEALVGLVDDQIVNTRKAFFGGDSRLLLEDMGKVAGSCDVTVQYDFPRNVVKVEQIMDALSDT